MDASIGAPVTPRTRDLGGIIAETFRIYRDNYLTFVIILAAYDVPVAALTAAQEAMPELFWVFSLLVLVVTIIGAPLMTGASIHAAGQGLAGGRADAGLSYGEAWRRLRSLLWAGILVGVVGVLLSITIVGIPVAIYFGVRWSMSPCAVMLEGYGGRAALSRSTDLVRGSWWRVFGIGIVVGLIFLGVMILGGITLGLLGAIASAAGTATSGLSYVNPASALLTILFGAFLTISLTVLFDDLRTRREMLGGPAGPSVSTDVPWKDELD